MLISVAMNPLEKAIVNHDLSLEREGDEANIAVVLDDHVRLKRTKVAISPFWVNYGLLFGSVKLIRAIVKRGHLLGNIAEETENRYDLLDLKMNRFHRLVHNGVKIDPEQIEFYCHDWPILIYGIENGAVDQNVAIAIALYRHDPTARGPTLLEAIADCDREPFDSKEVMAHLVKLCGDDHERLRYCINHL